MVRREGSLTAKRLAELYPHLYHMAEDGSWPSIRQHGLLSTSALLDLYGLTGERRAIVESARRPKSILLQSAEHDDVVVRDNIPMSDTALKKCLVDCTPTEWYRLLNERVFFWVSRSRLTRLLGARAYRNKAQLVLTIDTRELIERHTPRVSLSPINSGSTIMKPQPRGRNTFLPIEQYPFEAWRRKRRGRDPIVELTVAHSVPDIAEMTLKVERVEGGSIAETIWPI